MYTFRSFILNPAQPSEERLQEAARQFCNGILGALKGKSQVSIYVYMDLDIWRYISHEKGIACEHKGHRLYQKEDFIRFSSLPNHWWYHLDHNGEGQAIDCPVKIRSFLSWTPAYYVCHDNGKFLHQAPRLPLEKLCINMAKRPCNINNLYQQ